MMNETQNAEPTRREKIKTHFANHKEAYICGGAGIGLGFLLRGQVPRNISIVFLSKNAKSIAGQANNILEHVKQTSNLSQAVWRPATQTLYPSQAKAAADIGISASRLSQHLNGKIPTVNGGEKLFRLGTALGGIQ